MIDGDICYLVWVSADFNEKVKPLLGLNKPVPVKKPIRKLYISTLHQV